MTAILALPQKNESAAQSFYQRLYKSAGDTDIIHRATQLTERLPAFIMQIGELTHVPIWDCVSNLKSSVGKTIAPVTLRTFKVIVDAFQSPEDAVGMAGFPLSDAQKSHIYFRQTTERVSAASMFCITAALWSGLSSSTAKVSSWFKKGYDVLDTASSAMQFGLHVKNLKLSYNVNFEPAEKDFVAGQRYADMLGLAKEGTSVVTGAASIVATVSGLSLLPGIAKVAIDLSTTLFAITKRMYSDSMQYKIDFALHIKFPPNDKLKEVNA